MTEFMYVDPQLRWDRPKECEYNTKLLHKYTSNLTARFETRKSAKLINSYEQEELQRAKRTVQQGNIYCKREMCQHFIWPMARHYLFPRMQLPSYEIMAGIALTLLDPASTSELKNRDHVQREILRHANVCKTAFPNEYEQFRLAWDRSRSKKRPRVSAG